MAANMHETATIQRHEAPATEATPEREDNQDSNGHDLKGSNGRVGPYDQVFARVVARRSQIHGRGLFADERIPKGKLIGRYAGPLTRRIGAYTLWFTDDEGNVYGISGKNILRFVNHSCKPNAVFYDEELFALRTIQPGEEITHHYGVEWEDD